MSTQRTRCPFSANAAARFSVVVVLATPPFWLANAMTCGVVVTSSSGSSLGFGRRAAFCLRSRRPIASRIRMPGGESFRHVSDLFEKRLVFVTGKGGAGKTTVAAALGLAAARAGKRTIVCEVARQERVSRAFHREGVGANEAKLADGLFAISIDPQLAVKEDLEDQTSS